MACHIVDRSHLFVDAREELAAFPEAVIDCEIHFLERVHVVSVCVVPAESQDWLVYEGNLSKLGRLWGLDADTCSIPFRGAILVELRGTCLFLGRSCCGELF